MSLTSVVIDIVSIGVTSVAAGVLADAAMTEPQNWTILGLLAAVVLGVGYGMIKAQEKSGERTASAIEKSNDRVVAALEKHADAQTQTATNLALLIRESAEAREEGEEKRRQILDKLEHMPDRVATVLRK